eukprot:TRINITY_DN11488_c0_g1_i2.p1 TRINITY_DN11488_c0_g1~~TRINITY_DN11488_c0_g1_i2.p1  ORF type:complete len:408 (-),score=55.50 TRINITY_DN11488_c0_g1_i2:580-1803(-)
MKRQLSGQDLEYLDLVCSVGPRLGSKVVALPSAYLRADKSTQTKMYVNALKAALMESRQRENRARNRGRNDRQTADPDISGSTSSGSGCDAEIPSSSRCGDLSGFRSALIPSSRSPSSPSNQCPEIVEIDDDSDAQSEFDEDVDHGLTDSYKHRYGNGLDLLMRMGWKPGQGCGKSGTGIKECVQASRYSENHRQGIRQGIYCQSSENPVSPERTGSKPEEQWPVQTRQDMNRAAMADSSTCVGAHCWVVGTAIAVQLEKGQVFAGCAKALFQISGGNQTVWTKVDSQIVWHDERSENCQEIVEALRVQGIPNFDCFCTGHRALADRKSKITVASSSTLGMSFALTLASCIQSRSRLKACLAHLSYDRFVQALFKDLIRNLMREISQNFSEDDEQRPFRRLRKRRRR